MNAAAYLAAQLLLTVNLIVWPIFNAWWTALVVVGVMVLTWRLHKWSKQ